MELRNRNIVLGHATGAGVDHLPGEHHVRSHTEKARGGVGVIVVEAIRVHPTRPGRAQSASSDDPRGIPACRRVADAVHTHGAKRVGPISHHGRHVEGDFGRTATWGAAPSPDADRGVC